MDKPITRVTKKQTILAVDDVSSNLMALDAIYRKAGFAVSVAISGEDALKVLSRAVIDVAVLDIEMPQMSGIELYRKMLSDPETNKIPVIFVTADNILDTVKEALALGAVGYVVKPYDSKHLIQQTLRALDTAKVDQGILYMLRAIRKVRDAAERKDPAASELYADIPMYFFEFNAATTLLLNRLQNALSNADYTSARDLANTLLGDWERQLPADCDGFSILRDEILRMGA